MGNFEKMTIPTEADGIIDDIDAFEKQQKINEDQLREEIEDTEDLALSDYEDIQGEFVPSPDKKEYSQQALEKIQSQNRKIGRIAILFGSR